MMKGGQRLTKWLQEVNWDALNFWPCISCILIIKQKNNMEFSTNLDSLLEDKSTYHLLTLFHCILKSLKRHYNIILMLANLSLLCMKSFKRLNYIPKLIQNFREFHPLFCAQTNPYAGGVCIAF